MCSLSCLQGDLGDGEVEDSRVGDIMRHGSVEWLTASFGQSTQANAWAGPDHWKYHKPRGKCCNNPFLVFPACHRHLWMTAEYMQIVIFGVDFCIVSGVAFCAHSSSKILVIKFSCTP